jgi:hypothetical protein
MKQLQAKIAPTKWYNENYVTIGIDVHHSKENYSILGFHARIHGPTPF